MKGFSIFFVLFLLTGCSSHHKHAANQQPSSGSSSGASLAYSYSYQDLVHGSDVIALVQIHGVDHVDKQKGATYYDAKVLGFYKKGDAQTNNLIVKQAGYKSKNNSLGVEGHTLFQKKQKAVLFLTKDAGSSYKIFGDDQGRFDLVNGKVHSIEYEKMNIKQFKRKIEGIVQKAS